LSSRLVVMKLTLTLLAIVGCAYASTSISSSNCVNGHCISCDNNGCRESRSESAVFGRSVRGVSVCNCINGACQSCEPSGCSPVSSCVHKREVEKRETSRTCACLGRSLPPACFECNKAGVRDYKRVENCNHHNGKRSAEKEEIDFPDFPSSPDLPDYPIY
ncbi:hypothetical protein PFISCL1PPCAC_7791, partial [Pristionchus fissidentatus]